MPKVLLDFLGYAFYFWANEGNEPPHIHVAKGQQTHNSTKFWLTREGIKLADNKSKIPAKDLKKIERYILSNQDTILAQWYRFFKM